MSEIKLDPPTKENRKVAAADATEAAAELISALGTIGWQKVEIGTGNRLLEELIVATRRGAEILRRRQEIEEQGKCAAPNCKTKFGPTQRIVGTIVMNDEKTNLPRAYSACSIGCYAQLEKLERDRRMARFQKQG